MTSNLRFALVILAAAYLGVFAAHASAQTVNSAGTFTQGATSNALVAPGAVSVTLQGAQAPNAVTSAEVYSHGQPVASAAPVYVNSPSPATCVNAGLGASLQTGTIGGAMALGGGANIECDAREGAKTAKFLGLPDAVSREMLCDVPTYRAAFQRAGMPCLADRPHPATVGQSDGGPTDPFIRQRLGLPPVTN